MRGITTVNIGGAERTLSLKNNFLVLLGIQMGCDPLTVGVKISEVAEKNPLQALTVIIYCGLAAYQERCGNYAHGLKLADVAGWVDDADSNEFSSVWAEFTEIMGFPKASEEQIARYEEELKKKLTPTASAKASRSKKR